MTIKILMLFLMTALMNVALADTSETIKVVQVLKGDTFIGVNYKGVGKIYHLSGVDCAELNTPDGVNAKNFMNQLLLNQQAYVTTTVDAGSHALAWVSQGLGGSGRDIGAEIIKMLVSKCGFR